MIISIDLLTTTAELSVKIATYPAKRNELVSDTTFRIILRLDMLAITLILFSQSFGSHLSSASSVDTNFV